MPNPHILGQAGNVAKQVTNCDSIPIGLNLGKGFVAVFIVDAAELRNKHRDGSIKFEIPSFHRGDDGGGGDRF